MSLNKTEAKYQTDIVIFGGGIAGLWLLNRLRSDGYKAILIEKDTIGGVQTLASQGMIHGGQKYTLTGLASKHAVNIAQMPEIWAKCFDGSGEMDLSGVDMLSNSQIMWAMPNIASNVGVFAAAKAVNANTKKLSGYDVPEVLRLNGEFKGKTYRMDECVLDIKALIGALYNPHKEYIYQAELEDLENTNDGVCITLKDGIKIKSSVVIFTAGAGNETALEKLGVKKQVSQLRPLKQVMVKGMDYPLYGHCIVANPKPRVTITSHPIGNGKYVWYMGGAVAESSVKRSDLDAMHFAKNEMCELFPKIDWSNLSWAVWSGDRAEPYNATGHMPQEPHFMEYDNVLVAWPTKLTFAPALANKISIWLKDKAITAGESLENLALPKAEIGKYPWEIAKWHKI